MPGQKRTYSSKGRGKADPDFAWKRLKTVDSDSELRLPNPKPRKPQQSSTLLKKGLPKFGGPVSFTEEYDSDTASVAEDPRKGKLKPVINKTKRTHESMPDLGDAMDYEPSTKSSYGRASGHLPTPPTEMQKQQNKLTSHFFDNRNVGNINLATQVTTPAWKRKTTPSSSEASFESKGLKEPYVRKQYESDKASAPHRDLTGGRLSSKSNEAKLWLTNQSSSPFLRLPAEIRNTIYEEALGGNTILIGYQTYRSSARTVLPVFKYSCTVYNIKTNPFKKHHNPRITVSTGFTLLSSVCRQLYLESDVLASKLNLLAFTNHNVMANFLLFEQRFSLHKRLAIKELALRDPPGPNIMEYLPNLEEVYMDPDISWNMAKGWYIVVRNEGRRPELRPKYPSRY